MMPPTKLGHELPRNPVTRILGAARGYKRLRNRKALLEARGVAIASIHRAAESVDSCKPGFRHTISRELLTNSLLRYIVDMFLNLTNERSNYMDMTGVAGESCLDFRRALRRGLLARFLRM